MTAPPFVFIMFVVVGIDFSSFYATARRCPGFLLRDDSDDLSWNVFVLDRFLIYLVLLLECIIDVAALGVLLPTDHSVALDVSATSRRARSCLWK